MYDFCYRFIEEKVNNFNILCMDTDSFIIEGIGENFDDIIFENKEYFDLSNFSKNSGDNKKVPGKIKDEYGRTPILEYVGAKPKSYTLIDINNCEKSVHKEQAANLKM